MAYEYRSKVYVSDWQSAHLCPCSLVLPGGAVATGPLAKVLTIPCSAS